MRCLILATLASLFLVVPAVMAGDEKKPIPQNPEQQKKRHADKLAWNQRTLAGAYDKVGKKDPRWNKPAREALETAARYFSQQVDPCIKIEELYAPAKRAIDAGCDDPLILYLYATSSYKPNFPGIEEQVRRFTAAAVAMERSAYPPFRRYVALRKAAFAKLEQKNLAPEARKELTRQFDAALALLPKIVKEDERNPEMEYNWFEVPLHLMEGYQKLTGDAQTAFDRVDKVLAQVPELKAIRLQVRAQILIRSAWEARGNGFANTVTEEGWKKFRERLTEARKALEQSWALKPGDQRTPTLMLMVEKGIGGDRSEMEKWFQRAMKADGDYRQACVGKLDWLDPKWHGSREEMLAFGRECRDTKNWRAGITLLVADAYYNAAKHMPKDEASKYLHSEEVRNDIKAVFEEYLKHYTENRAERSRYAAYCFVCGWYAESDKQFKVLGDDLVYTIDFPEQWMKQVKAYVAAQARTSAPEKPRK